MIEKIISGGQTGADLGGLKAALKLGLKTGGLAPRGFKTENGPNPDLFSVYGLGQAPTDDYSYRTAANVRASHATVVFATKASSPGTKLTIKTCEASGKPFIVLNPFASDASVLLTKFIAGVYLRYGRNLILNVAGNRESKSAGIESRVEYILINNLNNNI
jgi:hypothetical protein